MKKKYIFLLSILTISVSAELFKCKLPEYQVKPGAKACSDRPFKLKEVPKEFSGLTGIQTKMGDKQGSALKLLLNQPARIYGVFNWPRLLEASEWSKLPKGWSLYWKSAPNIFKNFTCDIYFLDLPAGQHELKFNSSWICLGIKPASQLTAQEQNAAVFYPGKPYGLYKFGEHITGRLNNRCDWKVVDSDMTTIKTGKSDYIDVQVTKPGLYFIQLNDVKVHIPVYLKPEKQPKVTSVKNRIPICLDIRQIAEYWGDTNFTMPVLYSAAVTMTQNGANLAYANLNNNELALLADFGISVIMDVRREIDPAIPRIPNLFGWFDSKIVNRKDISKSIERYNELKKTAGINNHLFMYKPMSFNASWVGCGDLKDPLTLWRILKPPVRTLRCTPFTVPFDAQTSYSMNGADLASTFAITERCEKTPWFMMFSAYGDKDVKDRISNIGRRIPDTAEIKALCHLALANGAKAIFVYRAAQDNSLVNPVTGRPLSKSIAGLKDIADFLKKSSNILTKTSETPVKVYCANTNLAAIPRRSGKKIYIYVVSKNSKNTESGKIYIWPKKRSKKSTTIEVSLPPGSAKLLPVGR